MMKLIIKRVCQWCMFLFSPITLGFPAIVWIVKLFNLNENSIGPCWFGYFIIWFILWDEGHVFDGFI